MNKYERLRYILPTIAFLLLIAQVDFSMTYEYGLSILAMAVVLIIMHYSDYLSKSTFLFICILYISSFFVLFEPLGHTFASVAFVILVLYRLKGRTGHEISYSDNVIGFMIIILVLFTILGWLFKSELELRYMITAVITFFSFILVFNLARKITWNIQRIKVFYSIVCIMMIYSFFTTIINPFNIIPINTPLLRNFDIEYIGGGTMFFSMTGRPSTATGAMYALFILPFLITGNFKHVQLKGRIVFVAFVASILICFLGFSKSHSVVLVLGLLIGVYLMIQYFSLNFSYAVNLFSAVILFSIFVYFSSSLINYSYIFTRFEKQPEIFSALINDPLRLKGTSREASFNLGLESLGRENWIIGYGYANGGMNRIAWLGAKKVHYAKKDFHNTYYSLPQVFGWAGAVAYLLLFIITIYRLRKIILFKRLPIQYRLFALSFMLFFIIHLLTEYSITALSSPHYMFMLFIMLGLANALYFNFRKGLLIA